MNRRRCQVRDHERRPGSHVGGLGARRLSGVPRQVLDHPLQDSDGSEVVLSGQASEEGKAEDLIQPGFLSGQPVRVRAPCSVRRRARRPLRGFQPERSNWQCHELAARTPVRVAWIAQQPGIPGARADRPVSSAHLPARGLRLRDAGRRGREPGRATPGHVVADLKAIGGLRRDRHRQGTGCPRVLEVVVSRFEPAFRGHEQLVISRRRETRIVDRVGN